MTQVDVKQEVRAPAREVWELVSSLEETAERWPVVESYDIQGRGVGCVRTLNLVGDERIVERIEAFDPATRSYGAQVLEAGRLPLRDVRYRVAVVPAGSERCTVEWSISFEVEGISEESGRRLVEGFYRNATTSIRESLKAG